MHDLLGAFRIADLNLGDAEWQDIGVFSRIMQDVEVVYLSIDSVGRYGEILNFLGNVRGKWV